MTRRPATRPAGNSTGHPPGGPDQENEDDIRRTSAVQQQDPVQREINQAAARLRELMGLESSTEEIVGAVEDLKRLEENKSVLLRFQHEVFNAGDWSAETLQRNLTDDFIDHAAMHGDPPGLEGVQMRFGLGRPPSRTRRRRTMSRWSPGDLLAVMYSLHAQHSGPFMGIEPSRREVASRVWR